MDWKKFALYSLCAAAGFKAASVVLDMIAGRLSAAA